MRFPRLIGVLTIGLLVLGCIPPGVAKANHAPDSTYDTLDILFLVDQSQSMGGPDYRSQYNTAATDGRGLRFSAVQYAIDWLGNFRVQQARVGTKLNLDLSVTNFGGQDNQHPNPNALQEITLDWKAIDAATVDEWSASRNSLTNAVSAETFGKRNLGSSDFVKAFEKAYTQFSTRNKENALQVIVLLTDSEPCAPDTFFEPNCTREQDKQKHMKQLADGVKSKFSATNQLIYAVLLYSDRIQRIYHDQWQAVAPGRAFEINKADDIPAKFSNILTDVGTRMVNSADKDIQLGKWTELPRPAPGTTTLDAEDGKRPMEVPPYQQMMTVWLLKSNNDAQLRLITPGGKLLGGPSSVVNQDKNVVATDDVLLVTERQTTYEMWIVGNPTPGTWTISTQLKGTDNADPGASYLESTVRAGVNVSLPDGFQFMFQPVAIMMTITGVDGKPLPSYPLPDQPKVLGNVSIISPSGAGIVAPLGQAEKDKSNLYTARFIPFEAGLYKVAVQVHAGDGSTGLNYSSPLLDLPSVRTTVTVDGLEAETLQFIQQRYQLRFYDPQGKPLPNISVNDFSMTLLREGDTNCRAPNGNAEKLPAFKMMDGVPTIEGDHRTPGNHVVCVNVAISDPTTPNHEVHVVLDGQYKTLRVNAVQPLALKLSAPVERSASDHSSIILLDQSSTPVWIPVIGSVARPYWEMSPVKIEVHIVDAGSGKDVPVRQDLEPTQINNFLKLTILNRDHQPVSGDAALQPTADNAVWSVVLPGLGSGDYTINIDALPGQLGKTNRAILPADIHFSQAVTVNPNYLVLGIQVGMAVLAFLISLLILSGLWELIRNWLNPLKGVIEIYAVDTGGASSPVHEPFVLDKNRKKQHRLKFRLQDLPVVRPPLTGLTVQTIGLFPRNPNIKVFYRLQNERKPVELAQGEKKLLYEDLDGSSYFLLRVQDQVDEANEA